MTLYERCGDRVNTGRLLNNLGGLDLPTAGELRYRDFDLTAAEESEPIWAIHCWMRWGSTTASKEEVVTAYAPQN